MRNRWVLTTCALALAVVLGGSVAAAASGTSSDDENRYKLTRLVSDKPDTAVNQDPNLVNAWGLVAGPIDAVVGGQQRHQHLDAVRRRGNAIPLVVKVGGAPTGTVFNGGSGFVVSHDGASGPSLFLFSTENGTIRGWNPAVPPPAPSGLSFKVVDRSGEGAIYKGLAIATTAAGGRLYATDFHNARVDVFDESFNLVTTAGAFHDPGIPAGFAPFGIQTIGSRIFVTYAKQDADAEDDVAGARTSGTSTCSA